LESRNVTKSDIEKHHSSKIRVAKDALYLMTQIKDYLALIDFLFSSTSYLYVATKTWETAIEKNSRSFNMLCTGEQSHVVMIILTIIENRTQLFLKSCSISPTLNRSI
jgi:hypothetical protein